MKYAFAVLTVLGLWGVSPPAHPHPVIYEGGWSVMSEQSSNERMLTVTHSLKPYFSMGVEWVPEQTPSARLSLLLHRWNQPDSQANALFSLVLGADGKTGAAVAQVDWESRHLYTMLETRHSVQHQRPPLHRAKARVGFAPFLAEFDELSAWVILEARSAEETWSASPILRFYYRNVLWELGANADGSMIFNFMVHI